MLKTIKLHILACKIEYHWRFITPGRKTANRMIDVLLAKNQSPLNSPKLTELYHRLNRHCTQVSALTQKYKELSGMLPLELNT